MEPKMFSYTEPMGCSKVIRGTCTFRRFEAGIERYYVPQHKAKDLEAQIRSKAASIVLSITHRGQVQIKDLLIDGKPWRDQRNEPKMRQ